MCITPISYNIKCYCNNDQIYLCNWLWESICDGYNSCLKYCINYYENVLHLTVSLMGCKNDSFEGLRLLLYRESENIQNPWYIK